MFVAKHNNEKKIDDLFSKIVLPAIKDAITNKNDDFLLLGVGSTGTGKSALMLHAFEEFSGSEATVENIGLDKQSFAKALKNVQNQKQNRFCANDEANISKRDSLTKYNKDLIDLYLAIRGLNIFHWWNNPSIDILDKHFIEERIKGMIFITTKTKDKPRIYYYYRKKDLLAVWEKYGHFKLNLLRRLNKKYAYYKGWFKDYDGILLKPYLEKKTARMSDKVNNFFESYGKEEKKVLSTTKLSRLLQISSAKLSIYTNEMLKDGLLIEGENYNLALTGRKIYDETTIDLFKNKIITNKNKMMKTQLKKKGV